MNDGTFICLILGVIYLLDCLHLVNRNAVVFSAWLGSHCKAAFAGMVGGTRSSGVVLSPLFPPLGQIFITQPLPVSFAPTGVCSFITPALTPAGRPRQVARFVRYDEIKRLSCEVKDVLINGEMFVKCRSPRVAGHITETIRTLAKAPPEERERLIREVVAASFNVAEVRVAVEAFRGSTRVLRIVCNLLWFFMFVVCPILTFGSGVGFLMVPVLVVLLGLHVMAVSGYWRVHKKLMGAESYHRWEGWVKMVFCPPAAVRALDLISMDLLDRYHPLAVACVLTDKQEFQRLGWVLVREARHSLPVDTSVRGLAEIAEWHRQNLLEAAETCLKGEQVDLDGVDRMPTRSDASVKSYCPRCRTVYTMETGECPDCRGLVLVSWKQEGR